MTQWRTRFSYALGIVGLVLAVEALAPALALASARIVSIQGGTVQVRRSNGRYVRGRVNTRLNSGDALLPEQGARVRVQCPNGRRRRATAGRLSGMQVICPDLARSTRARNENDLPQLLAGQFPYVPRVWGDAPTFIWPDVSPNAPYRVQVIQVTFVQPESSDPFEIPAPERVETVVHEATATDNRWTYGGPPLGVEGRYQVRIETPMATLYQVPFQLVPPEAATALTEGVAALQDLETDVETEALAVAYLYRDAELYWAVIDLLQPFVAQGEVSATIHQLLAESYVKTGNTGAAATHFSAAVTLAQVAADLRTEAEAWVGLAKVAAAGQDRDAVVERLQTAQTLYGILEMDEGWLSTLEIWLEAIN